MPCVCVVLFIYISSRRPNIFHSLLIVLWPCLSVVPVRTVHATKLVLIESLKKNAPSLLKRKKRSLVPVPVFGYSTLNTARTHTHKNKNKRDSGGVPCYARCLDQLKNTEPSFNCRRAHFEELPCTTTRSAIRRKQTAKGTKKKKKNYYTPQIKSNQIDQRQLRSARHHHPT